jgi:predicted DNA-binding mobile mystery protein A
MKERRLILDQLDRKIIKYKNLDEVISPPKGWIYSIRKALNMSLRQLGNRMEITPQSVREIEERERNGTVSINVLKQVGRALNMKLVYGFIPRSDTLEKMIEERAYQLAKEIVQRTSVTMSLEDQKTSDERIEKAIKEKAEEIKTILPRYLWD